MTCLWDLAEGSDLPFDWTSVSEPIQQQARELASRSLERLCAYRVGVCPVKVRVSPHSPSCAGAGIYGGHNGPRPLNWGGTWSNVGCDCHRSQCERKLPAPIGRIDAVEVDGVTLAAADYRIEDDAYLVWAGAGECPFVGKDLVVTYVNAYPPGVVGKRAATILAIEFAKAFTNQSCRLPPNVTSLARQGVTMTLVSGAFPDGKTGLREVDAFIALWNPHNIQAPQVWSPDTPTVRRIS